MLFTIKTNLLEIRLPLRQSGLILSKMRVDRPKSKLRLQGLPKHLTAKYKENHVDINRVDKTPPDICDKAKVTNICS